MFYYKIIAYLINNKNIYLYMLLRLNSEHYTIIIYILNHINKIQ